MVHRIRSLTLLAVLAGTEASAAVFAVQNTNSSGAGSLHQAITSANATFTADTITFQIPGAGVKKIVGALPAITQPLTINGYSQPGSSESASVGLGQSAVVLIEIDAQGLLPGGSAVLDVLDGPFEIRGVAIRGIGVNGSAIRIASSVVDATIQGCFLGTDATGMSDGSSGNGIVNEGIARIGGTAPADRNLISAHGASAIVQTGPDAVIEGNLIGADAAGGFTLSNARGIVVTGANAACRIGGFEAGAGNIIVAHSDDAIIVASNTTSATGIFRNSIYRNGGIGIDLGDDGITPNDLDDVDEGANDLQNSFEITFAVRNGNQLRLEGYLNGQPGNYQVEVFLGDELNSQKLSEGEFLLGLAPVTIPLGQTRVTVKSSVATGRTGLPLYVTATATSEATGATSEFSPTVEVVDGGEVLFVDTTADEGGGSLRAAVLAANEDPDPNTILLTIPGSGTKKIVLSSDLTLLHPTIIDGYAMEGAFPNTHPDAINNVIRVELDGVATDDFVPGIAIASHDCIVRGLAVLNFSTTPILVGAASRTRIEGNFIGTDATGLLALGNLGSGVMVYSGAEDTVIGGRGDHHRNLITDNGFHGIVDLGLRTIIQNNFIGGSAATSAKLGNVLTGILSVGFGGDIGGDALTANVIRNNGTDGIQVNSGGKNARILANSIFDNGDLAIDLNSNGVTANDANDSDQGPNALQNFPVVDDIEYTVQGLSVSGTLDVGIADAATHFFRFDLYENAACDPSGNGEAERWLGSQLVGFSNTSEQFELAVPSDATPGRFLTMTATELDLRNTSELSACAAIPPPPVCGDASGDGNLTAADALFALRTAVGTFACLPCVCDVNGGGIASSDALGILRKSVGQNVTLVCPDC